MSDQTDSLTSLLTPFGLSIEEAKIYLFLAQNGTLSALSVSRAVHMARTKVYRILDKLVEKQLVHISLDDMGKKYGANSYKELELLLKEKEAEVEKLKQTLPFTMEKLAQVWATGQVKSKVLYHTGIDGLKQITWNSTRAHDILRIYEVEQDMTAFLTPAFSEKIRQELVDNRIFTRQLTNKKHILPYTKISQIVKNFWEVRFVESKQLGMQFECLLYNDVFVLYNFSGKDQFCVEIYNEKLASMQKQIFDFIWNKASKMKIINEQGEAVVGK